MAESADSEKKSPTEKSEEEGILVTEKSMEILVAKFIPTSQYFERSFLMLQNQVVDLRDGQKDLKRDMERRFELVDKRFEQVDASIVDLKQEIDKRFEQAREETNKRFEQVDKRFEQVDKRFDSIESKLDTLIDKVDIKIDAGLRENRSIAVRLFTFAMLFSAVSMAGVLGKIAGIF